MKNQITEEDVCASPKFTFQASYQSYYIKGAFLLQIHRVFLLVCSGTNTENLTSWFMLEGNLEISFSFYLRLTSCQFFDDFFHIHQHTENRDEIYKPSSYIYFHSYSCKLPSQENH